ncbi:helix-turn-helix domain-containing protein [Methylobacterium trifolii]|uniref:HTH-type transcriptional activator RhaS n=1 Tax=Methylobacterium trifolii TaxID=1003092 RepID=A0ABQ4TSN1_9HYPH|nr:helix-turn-helix domain-containing protein [Methylobacterium trifolii]GJE58195.1 HTH-type transcriptional activator RhaS [Methylobacterium trifolii]
MKGHGPLDPATWRPQSRLVASITSLRQLQVFNDRGGIAVDFDIRRSIQPDIEVVGSQSEAFSFWETRSASGFVTKPKFNAELVTIRFVTNGQIVYRHRTGKALGSPTHATLVGFEDLREVQASSGFNAVSATIAVEALVAANDALTGGTQVGLQPLAPIAEMTLPGMQALFCTLRQVQSRIQDVSRHDDLIFPLLKEVMSYQLLSSWPKREQSKPIAKKDISRHRFQTALDYIESHLSGTLMLADIAAAAGISVRSLQDDFRRRLGSTPVQFIIDRRLQNVHQDLSSPTKAMHSIGDVARRWGFVHMSDFGQRYRRLYGYPPSETPRDAARHH